MEQFNAPIPAQLSNPLHLIAKNKNIPLEDVIREALLDLILKEKFPSPLRYDDDDATLLKNAAIASSLSLNKEEGQF